MPSWYSVFIVVLQDIVNVWSICAQLLDHAAPPCLASSPQALPSPHCACPALPGATAARLVRSMLLFLFAGQDFFSLVPRRKLLLQSLIFTRNSLSWPKFRKILWNRFQPGLGHHGSRLNSLVTILTWPSVKWFLLLLQWSRLYSDVARIGMASDKKNEKKWWSNLRLTMTLFQTFDACFQSLIWNFFAIRVVTEWQIEVFWLIF